MNTAAKVAERKERFPWLYCPKAGCLWMTATTAQSRMPHAAADEVVGACCPRHGGVAK